MNVSYLFSEINQKRWNNSRMRLENELPKETLYELDSLSIGELFSRYDLLPVQNRYNSPSMIMRRYIILRSGLKEEQFEDWRHFYKERRDIDSILKKQIYK